MKHVKRFLSALLVLALTMSFSTAVFAASPAEDTGKGHVHITETGNNHSTYNAYQLLTIAGSREVNGTTVYQYKIHEYYREALKAVTKKTSDTEIIEYLQALTANSTPEDFGLTVRDFADAMFEYLDALKPKQLPQATVQNNGAKEVILDLDPGYYLFQEVTSPEDEGSVTSLVMLETVAAGKHITLNTKEDAPSLVKKVHDINDTEGEKVGSKWDSAYWQDSADHDIGDLVDYKLEATLGDISAFDERYYLAFHDTMSKGLTFAGESTVKVYLQKQSGGEPVLISSGYSVTTDNKSEKYSDGTSWTLEFLDIKAVVAALGNTLEKGDKVVVMYQATLNEKAELGYPGNPNVAYLQYSNNPYSQGDGTHGPGDEGGPDTGKTPEDKCIVFTFAAQVNKVDGNKQPLKGAGFTLYKQVPELPEDDDGEYITLTEESGNTAGDGDTDEGGEGDEPPAPAEETYWKKIKEIVQKDGTEFKFEGLDDGNYMLRETTTPAGYYAIEDLFFAITAEHDTLSDNPELKKLTVKALGDTGNWQHSISEGDDIFKADLQSGIISTTIMNVTGARLPSTGGIGTTIFYVAGGIVVLGAAVLLVLKKRNGAGK